MSLTTLRCRKLFRALLVGRYRSALLKGVLAASEHERIPLEGSYGTVIDVGAHTGQFALVAAKRFPRAKIYCVEPLAEAREKLEQVLGGRVVTLPFAAAAEAGEVDMYVTPATDSSSLLQPAHRNEIRRERVPKRRLDEVLKPADLPRPILLKADVQGYELEALRGAEGFLTSISGLVVECSFAFLYRGQPLADEVVCYLHQHGFRLWGVYNMAEHQADFWFRRGQQPRLTPPVGR